MKKLVILTGSGMSAESGIKTFRDSGGLWEDHDVMQVASVEGWLNNPELVVQFYNKLRRRLAEAKPNAGHMGLVELEKYFHVQIITQNVDDLHERAGSSNILHLHGELTKACCTGNKKHVFNIGYRDIEPGETCEDGYILRPDIVWFGEAVPAMNEAVKSVQSADIFVVIGTSLLVYPAAGLIDCVQRNVPIYLIDPKKPDQQIHNHYTFIMEGAGTGVARLTKILIKEYKS